MTLYVGIVLATLRLAQHRDVVFWHLAVAIVGLATVATPDLLLAFSKAEGLLGGQTPPILAAHATLMLGGWVAPMFMGGDYRLVGMFTLSENRLDERCAWAALACVGGGAWSLAVGLLGTNRLMVVVGATGRVVDMLLFAPQLVHLHRMQRPRQFDIHMPFTLTAACFGLLAIGLVLTGLVPARSAGDPI